MAKNIADNPARRLHDLLQHCKEISSGDGCRASWHKVLKTEDEPELLVRLGKLIELTRETVSVMQEAFPHHVDSLRELQQQIANGVAAQNLNAHWGTFADHVKSHPVVALGFAATLLDERAALRSADKGGLADQRQRLAELRAEVVASEELPKEMRLTIARYLGRLIASIDEYFITGIFPVLDAANTAIGAVASDVEYAGALRETTIGKKVAAALANVANTVTVATGAVQIADSTGGQLLRLLTGA